MAQLSMPALRGGLDVFVPCLLIGAGALGAACSGDDETSTAPRAVTTAELTGLVRSNVVAIATSEVRSGKAFETSKAWADAELDRIDCDLGAGSTRSCEAEVEAWADPWVDELLPASKIVETTATRTTWAENIDLGMTPYRIEWSLFSTAPDNVVAEVRLGGEPQVAATIRLSPTEVTVEADLASVQTLINMSAAMDDIDDADLLEALAGTVRMSLAVTGPRALAGTFELRNLGFTLGFMDGERMVLSSSGAFRVTAGQDGETRRATLTVELPDATWTLPAHLVQDDRLTACELPSDPCRPRADEMLRVAVAGARLDAAAAADGGELELTWTGPSDAWLTAAADGAEVARLDLGSFEADVQTATAELLLESAEELRAGFTFDGSPLMEAFDFDVIRERLRFRFVGRASVPTESQRGDPEGVLRVLRGSLSATAEELGDTIEVPAGQCLLSFDRARPGISEDHPFAFLGAGTCPR